MSTIKMRKMTAQDIDAVISLVNRTFNPPSPMDKAFPFIFSPSNTYSYVLEMEDKIVSFIGVVPIIWQAYYGVSIGAVCTDKDYQGQGLLRKLFPYAINDLKNQDIDFILVSGSGKVYMENNAQFYGTFYSHRIERTNRQAHVNLIDYDGGVKQLNTIHQLLNSNGHYDFGINELSVLLEAQGAASVLGLKPTTYLIEENQEIVAFLTHAYNKEKSRIIEYAGKQESVIAAIQTLNQSLNIEATDLVSLKPIAGYQVEKIQNEGTIIYTKEELVEALENIPYAFGLRFV
ncbi:MAG TPA: GNAT family N-acetyltransferase [Erysipelothrix sp.]